MIACKVYLCIDYRYILHSGRRYFANRLYRSIEGQHKRLYITQLLMGHEDPEMTLHYIDPDMKDYANKTTNIV